MVTSVAIILHWKVRQGELEERRGELMAKQRAVEVELGKRWFPIRDKVEGWTLDLAKAAGDEKIDTDALRAWNFQEMPGIYLRMSVADATDVEAIRKQAKESLKDAFTSCLVRYDNPSPIAGKECEHARDCAQGELCNEMGFCSPPSQPYNLRIAYRSMRVLSDGWMKDVQEADTELRIRLLENTFEASMLEDIPIAADLLTRAKYFLLVLDEKPASEPPQEGEEAPATGDMQSYPARVAVWRLQDDRNVLRIRRESSTRLVGASPADPKTLGARARQANSCGLALAVRTAMGDEKVPTLAPGVDAPSPDRAGGGDGKAPDDGKAVGSAAPSADAPPAP